MKKGIKKYLIVFAVIVVCAAGFYALYAGQGIQVFAGAVQKGTVEKLITESGSVEARNSVIISSKIQGQILAVHIKEGDSVTEGQRLAEYTRDSGAADIGSLRAQISGLSAQAKQADELAAKSEKLYNEGAMSYEEYSGTVTAAKQIASQIAALNYSIAGLSEAGGSKGIIAPISGTVTSVMVSEGETVAPGALLVEISDTSDIYIRVNLVSEDADEVSQGDTVRVFSESDKLIDDSAQVSKIYVKAQNIMSDLGIYQKRVPVEITITSGKNLRLGSDVNVEIVADQREDVLFISANAIFELNKQHYVYKAENGIAVLTSVETGLEGETYTEIKSGLSEGDLVILSPAKEIEDGKKIKVAE